MCEIELNEIQSDVYSQLMADADALRGKSNEYRALIAEKINCLAEKKNSYDSLFNDYLKPFCHERIDVFFCVFCMHYEIFYKQVASIYGEDRCIKLLNGEEKSDGELHDDIRIL